MTETGEVTPDRENLSDNGTGNAEGSELMISSRLLAGVIVTVLALIVAVVAVGLIRETLDVTGVATVLSTMFSGIVVGTLVKGRGRGDA